MIKAQKVDLENCRGMYFENMTKALYILNTNKLRGCLLLRAMTSVRYLVLVSLQIIHSPYFRAEGE